MRKVAETSSKISCIYSHVYHLMRIFSYTQNFYFSSTFQNSFFQLFDNNSQFFESSSATATSLLKFED